MPRRIVYSIKQIYENRLLAWEFHYKNRELARVHSAAGVNALDLVQALSIYYPKPELQIDGFMLSVPLYTRREHEDGLRSRFRVSRDLLCSWYWTESHWLEFVREYQNLPEIYQAYYLRYDPEPNDRALLVPMDSKPKQGSKPVDKCLISVDKPVDKPVEMSGTSILQKVQDQKFST